MRIKDNKKFEAICEAAMSVINSVGFAKASMSKIAKKADVSPATIYTYFENKEDMINQIFLNNEKMLASEVKNEIGQSVKSQQCFKNVLRKIFIFFVSNPEKFMFNEQFENSPLITNISKEQACNYYTPLKKLAEESMRKKEIKNLPMEMIRYLSIAPLFCLIKNHIQKNIKVDEKILDDFIDSICDSLIYKK